jgi:hypothetical protein
MAELLLLIELSPIVPPIRKIMPTVVAKALGGETE